MDLAELHSQFEELYNKFRDKSISNDDYSNALFELKARADAANLPFIFQVDLLSAVAANDDNTPWLATLDELDEEPWSSDVTEDYGSSDESSEDSDIDDDDVSTDEIEEL